jgi:Na+-driven multidrug efflux pump
LRATLVYSGVAAGLVALLADPITGAFIDDPTVHAEAVVTLRILAIGFAAAGVPPLVSAYFQALGRPRPSYLISVGSLLLVKVPLVLALGRSGPTGAWTGLAAGELVSAGVALLVLRRLDVPAGRGVGATSTTSTAELPLVQ